MSSCGRTWILILTGVSATFVGGCVSLRVVDDATGQPVPDAEVSCTCRWADAVRPIGKTDRAGKITFWEPEDLDTLLVSKRGYERWEGSHLWLVKNSSKDWGPVEVRLIPR